MFDIFHDAMIEDTWFNKRAIKVLNKPYIRCFYIVNKRKSTSSSIIFSNNKFQYNQ